MLRKKFVYIVIVFVCSIIVLADKYKEDNKNITRNEVVASNRNTNLNPFPEQLKKMPRMLQTKKMKILKA